MKKPFPLKHSWLNRIQCYSPGLWFSLTISLFAPTAVAQTNPQGSTPPFNTVTMPSPNAASLGKFGDITIGYHVGTPNIDVPIYELKQGDLNVPISLKYQPGGIKVADIPSWVGSGWALIAGGVITRAIVGLPDELNQVSPKRKVGWSQVSNATN
ncbi:MAG: hypothetical protein ACK5SJ_05645 [Bacteroidota bacterium]|jgi:hypothetical protein|nr:hypothetical protein [Cytophagales bacterium]